MVIVTDASDLSRITNSAIRKLVALRLQQLHSPDDLDSEPVELIVVESGDSVTAIEQAAGIAFMSTGLFDDFPFEHPDYVPPTEFIERHTHDNTIIFELFIVASDSGAGTAIFAPAEGIDTNLLLMLNEWATPAVSTP